jgi:hypothetical protein
VTEGNCKAEILANAAITEEDYFVAPPGNIPLEVNTSQYKIDNQCHKEMHKTQQ